MTGEKIETKTEKETDTLRNRLYLGTPRCGGLVWTLFGKVEAGQGTSHRGDPMPVPLWHSTKFLCTQCLWAGLDTSGYSPRRSTAQCGSLQRQSKSSRLWKFDFVSYFRYKRDAKQQSLVPVKRVNQKRNLKKTSISWCTTDLEMQNIKFVKHSTKSVLKEAKAKCWKTLNLNCLAYPNRNAQTECNFAWHLQLAHIICDESASEQTVTHSIKNALSVPGILIGLALRCIVRACVCVCVC